MSILANLVATTWVPIAYKFAPLWVGQHSLRGFLKNLGVDMLGVPLPVSRALAEECYRVTQFEARMVHAGLWREMAIYTEYLESTAYQIRALLYMQDRRDPFLRTCGKVKDTLEQHGIVAPPILVDRL